jgi:hypothetical protein
MAVLPGPGTASRDDPLHTTLGSPWNHGYVRMARSA